MRIPLAFLAVVLFGAVFSETCLAKAIEVHGHRGARAQLPENTLPAFDYALKAGVDFLEMDLVVTKDNELVVSHEPLINPEICTYYDGRPVKEKLAIRDLTLTEVKQFDCGSLKNTKFPKQNLVPQTRIPTFQEVLDFVLHSTYPKAKTVRFNVETKIEKAHPEWAPSPEEFVRLIVAKLRENGVLDRTVLQSFDYRTLMASRKLEPKLKISALNDEWLTSLVSIADKYHPDYISPKYIQLRRATLDRLHARGVKVIPWTVNDPKGWKAMLRMGVDGIITDDPMALIEYLNRNR